jgi:hypothetical protein
MMPPKLPPYVGWQRNMLRVGKVTCIFNADSKTVCALAYIKIAMLQFFIWGRRA